MTAAYCHRWHLLLSDDGYWEVSDAEVSDDAFSKPDDGFYVEKGHMTTLKVHL